MLRMPTFLDFEKPIADLQARIAELRDTADSGAIDIDKEVKRLETKSEKMLRDTYASLTPWQKTQVARHPDRPHFKDYVAGFVEDFIPLAGDRGFSDDLAIVGGLIIGASEKLSAQKGRLRPTSMNCCAK